MDFTNYFGLLAEIGSENMLNIEEVFHCKGCEVWRMLQVLVALNKVDTK